ncbi:MAG: nucleotidyltransferase domain-containing protein [bacterium]
MTPHDFARELERIYGDDLKAVVLYGSAAGGDYSRKFSDFNVFCVLSDVSPGTLAHANPLVRKWVKKGNPPPHFFGAEHIERSLDVFPMEFMDMLDRHETLIGHDPLAGITVETNNLRHQCESELKGKLIHLRTFYTANCHKPKLIAGMMMDSFPTFLAAMRATLRMLGEKPPADARAIAEFIGTRVGLNPTIFFDIIDIRRGDALLPRKNDALVAFEQYLTELDALTRYVDQMHC